MNKKNTRIIVISVCILAVLIAAFALIYTFTKPDTDTPAVTTAVTTAGETTATPADTIATKHLTVKLVFADKTEKTVEIDTTAANLRGALESVDGLIAGSESSYGLFVTTVNGVTADSDAQEWWCFTRGGETLMTGIDDTVIADGESYEITLTTGY